MKYDFDSIIDRIETRSTKWRKFDDPNILPMWVADMDFQCPPEVTEAIKKRVDQGIFGYTERPAELTSLLQKRLVDKSGWSTARERIVFLAGLVVAPMVCIMVLDIPAKTNATYNGS